MIFSETFRLFLKEYLDASTDSQINHPILYAIRKVKNVKRSDNNAK